jgi:hypothetical protein
MKKDSREAILKYFKRNVGGRGFLYQFEAGHWSYATYDSPIGESLRTGSMMIYPAINIRAKQVVEVNG